LPCNTGAPATGAGAGAGDTTGGVGETSGPDSGSGTEAHPASIPTIAATNANLDDELAMLLILLEALLALAVLVLIVWWTMFSGRPRGEPPGAEDDKSDGPPKA
jgi:hypothetical protein